MNWLDQVKWDANGLVPAIAQEVGSNDVLMFAFMNRDSLARTAELGEAVYFSRSRKRRSIWCLNSPISSALLSSTAT